jgi:hypothetical protein
VPFEIGTLFWEMSIANPWWEAPRIRGESLKLGIDVGRITVAEYMNRWRRPPSQGWETFLRNHADGIASMGLFVVPMISFKLTFGLVVKVPSGSPDITSMREGPRLLNQGRTPTHFQRQAGHPPGLQGCMVRAAGSRTASAHRPEVRGFAPWFAPE